MRNFNLIYFTHNFKYCENPRREHRLKLDNTSILLSLIFMFVAQK